MLWDAVRRSPLPDVAAVQYGELRDWLRDLDLLLWSSHSTAGRFIRLGQRIGKGMEGSWCSHCSLVLTVRGAGGMMHVLNLESTTESKTPDFFTRASRSGSQVNLLSHRLANYHGRVYVRRLNNRLRTPQAVARLHEIRLETSGLKYERNWREWIGAGVGWITNRENREGLFCSELVAHVFQEIGILGGERPSNEYAPADFTAARWPADGLYQPELEIVP